MKKLNKISRENLKSIKGGITPECASWWGSGRPYYTTEAACIQASTTDPILTLNHFALINAAVGMVFN